MTTLFRHVVLRFVATFGAVLGILCALVTTLKLVESSRAIMAHDAPTALALLLAACIALEFCHRLFFVALLLAAVLCTNRMAQSGELLGLWAQGHSPRVLSRPFLAASVGLTALMMLSGDRVLPSVLARRTALLQAQMGKVEPATLYFQKRSTWYADGDSIYHLPEVLPDEAGFAHPVLYKLEEGRLVAMLKADRLVYHANKGWFLHNAICHLLSDPNSHVLVAWPVPLTIRPADLMAHMGNPRELSHRKATALIARRESSGLDTTVHRLEVLERLAQPLSAPLLLWAALPWLLQQHRRRPLAGVLCLSIVAVACLLVAGQMLRLLSLGHHLPVFLGATGQVVCALIMLLLSAVAQIIFSGRTSWSKVAAST